MPNSSGGRPAAGRLPPAKAEKNAYVAKALRTALDKIKYLVNATRRFDTSTLTRTCVPGNIV